MLRTWVLLAASCAPLSTVSSYRQLVEKLAADEMEGRGVNTAGNEKATALLEASFADVGLEPAFDDGYRQCFEHPVRVSAVTERLTLNGEPLAGGSVAAAVFSSSGEVEGELVFAGYGISAPELGYDDYAGVDVTGKILLLLRYEPRERDPDSPFNGDKPSRFSEMRRKVFEAKSRGAVAVLFVAAPRAGEEPDTKVPSLMGLEPESVAGLVAAHVLPAVAEAWLRSAGTDLTAEVVAIDEKMKSRALQLGPVRLEVKLERTQRVLCNVVGLLPGRGSRAGEAVVVGAHFDHLGFGQSGSMEQSSGVVHNGADDNASGTAALVPIARMLNDDVAQPRRTLIFVAFNGEEVGLAGSSHYVNAPVVPLERTAAMLNMDMIGRLKDRRVTVLGTQSADEWKAWLDELAPDLDLEVVSHGDGYGPSDQTPFYANGVPVLHFFTGAHDDYHRASDDAEKLNFTGAVQVARLVAALAVRTAQHETKIAYRETSAGPPMAGDSRSFGAWLGTIPDYSAMGPDAGDGGVLLSGVRKGGPAAVAGVKAKDRIVAMAGRDVSNLYDMTFVLRDHHPGDVIMVEVMRDGERLSFTATLGSRSQMGGVDAHHPPK